MTPLMDTEDKKKKNASSGAATNDKELRQLLNQNEGRNLKEVAAEVIQNDRTSKAEKSKQLFAMLWYVRSRLITCRSNYSQVEIRLQDRQNIRSP